MTQSPRQGQGAPPRSEFGSVASAPPVTPYGQPSQQPYDTRTTTTVPAYPPPPGAPGAGGPGSGGSNGSGSAGASASGAPSLVSGAKAPLPSGAPASSGTPTNGAAPTAPAAGRPARGSARNRGPRRARLQLRHINPWTVLKFSCVLSIALFFVWLIVVGILFGVLDATGVVGKLNDAYIQVNPGATPPIRAGIVFGGAAIIGAVNIILFIALSTVGAVVYNLCADLVGGIEITLSER